MRQPDAGTNGRNLRFVLVADLGLLYEMARDLALACRRICAAASPGASAGRRTP
ncbi:hypothetical protein [Streptomyces sp. NPDC004270]